MYLRYLLLFFALLVGGCTKPSAYCETKRQCYSAQECDVGQHACYYPDLATPDLATPDLATLDLATPDLATPDLATPDLAPARPLPCNGATGWCKYPSGAGDDVLFAIWGDSPDNVWVSGYYGPNAPRPDAPIIHCQRDACQLRRPLGDVYYTSVWGVSANIVFLVGVKAYRDNQKQIMFETGVLVRCQAQGLDFSCSQMFETPSPVPPLRDSGLFSVWAIDQMNIWVGGRGSLIMRCNANAAPVCRVVNGPIGNETGAMVFVKGINPVNPDVVWATGGTIAKTFYRCDRDQCAQVNHAIAREFYGMSVQDDNNIWVTSDREFMGAGAGVILLCNAGTGCSNVPIMMSTPKSVTKAFAIGTDAWVVGGVAARCSSLTKTCTHYFPESQLSEGGTSNVWASRPEDAWVVGAGGSIMHCTPMCAMVPSNVTPDVNLLGIWGADARNIWAVGTKGIILRYVP